MMKAENMRTDPDRACPSGEDLTAYALGERDCVDSESIESHIDQCPRCKFAYEQLCATKTMIVAADSPAEPVDLRERIMSEIDRTRSPPAEAAPSRFRLLRRPRWLKYAAALTLLIGGALALLVLRPPLGDRQALRPDNSGDQLALRRGVNWLLERQGDDGGWSVELLGGQPRYSPALNGLALLAITRADSDDDAHLKHIRRGAQYLTDQQHENGRFGPGFDRAMYNHGISTLALLNAYAATGDACLRAPIEKALAYTRQTQSYSGGWGYVGARDDEEPNNSVTAWQVQALILADRLGWDENRTALRRAVGWIAGTLDRRGHFSYRAAVASSEDSSDNVTMTSAFCLMAAADIQMPIDPALEQTVLNGIREQSDKIPQDYYSAFYYSSAFAKAGTDHSEQVLQRVRNDLLARQQEDSWLADDRWGAVGGRIYSTAMSLMAIRQ